MEITSGVYNLYSESRQLLPVKKIVKINLEVYLPTLKTIKFVLLNLIIQSQQCGELFVHAGS